MSERLDAIVNHPLFISCYEQIQKLEEERVFASTTCSIFLMWQESPISWSLKTEQTSTRRSSI